MKLIEQSFEIVGECPSDFDESILRIEREGRICYRSESKIIEGSGIDFVQKIVNHNHLTVIEQSNLVIKGSCAYIWGKEGAITHFNSKYLNVLLEKGVVYAGGNWRAWIEWYNEEFDEPCTLENFRSKILPYGFEIVPTQEIPLPLKRVTVEFTTDRAVSHEMVRHRPPGFLQESQRYVSYNGDMLFIKPSWFDQAELTVQSVFLQSCTGSERDYTWLREHLPPEHSRTVLNNQTATKIACTTDLKEWNLIFGLRCSRAAYPQMRNLMIPVRDEFENRGWVI